MGAAKSVVVMNFNGLHPDFAFRVGDTKARLLQLAKSVGLDDALLAARTTG